jgi:hypothetical protein
MAVFVVYRRKKTSVKEKSLKNLKKETETESFMFLSQLGDVAISFNEKNEIIIEKSDKENVNQQWILSKANQNKEYFFIENVANGKVIEIQNADTNDGAKIVLNKKKKTKNDHQEWSFESSENKYYVFKDYVFIVSKCSLNVLDIKYKKTTNGTRLQSFHKKIRGTQNQEWKIEKI